MRTPSLSVVALMALVIALLSSCGTRDSWSGLPDRGGHAYNADPSAVAAQDAPADVTRDPALAKESVPGGPIQGSEQFHRVENGERLYQIAHRYGVSLYWLIKRNDLGDLPYSGQRLIVPGPAVQ